MHGTTPAGSITAGRAGQARRASARWRCCATAPRYPWQWPALVSILRPCQAGDQIRSGGGRLHEDGPPRGRVLPPLAASCLFLPALAKTVRHLADARTSVSLRVLGSAPIASTSLVPQKAAKTARRVASEKPAAQAIRRTRSPGTSGADPPSQQPARGAPILTVGAPVTTRRRSCCPRPPSASTAALSRSAGQDLSPHSAAANGLGVERGSSGQRGALLKHPLHRIWSFPE